MLDNEGIEGENEVLEQQTEGQEQQQEQPKDLRGQLERNFEEDRKATAAKAEKAEKASAKAKAGYKSRAREAAEEEEVEEGTEQKQPVEQSVGAAPDAFSKEAKAEWANVPPTVQSAILKREQDVAKGVQELRQRYTDIDQALAPHLEEIRRHGHTPAQAVTQLFAWFQALAANPQLAFPALAKSFNYDLHKVLGQQQQQPTQAEGEQPAGEVPPAVQQYITGLEQKLTQIERQFGEKLGGLESSFAQQSQAKTQEILDNWANGKEHFQDVRQLMAHFIASGAVPPKNGQVDLDAAYDMAIYAHPEVRAKVQAALEAAKVAEAKKKADEERKAQTQQAEKARKAGVSVGTSAPGSGGATTPAKGGKGKSVRESILEAREQLSS